MFKKASNWKRILTGLVVGLIVYSVSIDFRDPAYPDWNFFQQDRLPSSAEMHGASAAILAMAAAATLFIGLIPVGITNKSKKTDLYVRVVGAVAVAFASGPWPRVPAR